MYNKKNYNSNVYHNLSKRYIALGLSNFTLMTGTRPGKNSGFEQLKLVKNKLKKAIFSERLLAYTSIEMVFEMFFLILSNVDDLLAELSVNFWSKKLCDNSPGSEQKSIYYTYGLSRG